MLPSIFRRISTKEGNSILTGLLYGLINGVMLIPITISFCTIIYQDKGFERYLPQLVKLVMFSSMIPVGVYILFVIAVRDWSSARCRFDFPQRHVC